MKKFLNKIGVSTLTLMLSALLIFGGAIGGTLAWLTAKTEPVKNVFTVGQISLTLTETNEAGATVNSGTQTFYAVPGTNITKDPTVTVGAGSVASWIFVEITESKAFANDANIRYEVAAGWMSLGTTTNADGSVTRLIYREVSEGAADQEYLILSNNTVVVANEFAPSATAGEFSLTFTAYGIQKANLNTATDAWAALGTALNP